MVPFSCPGPDFPSQFLKDNFHMVLYYLRISSYNPLLKLHGWSL
ncbi:hypothetical protein HanXRQr2_Chr05g0225591 [Helianthus annuus]|uniref:Uncharacterized protein n=1 Tax=Helianthus annuus TaxID=4232 RepID=A0A9K3J1T9_HELAN|nr:hypothetical protein HanXRQr2_Chr05g0225591 [Helianthus annuus]KAJ0923578.1 hypothetical protein HanPSC8_Chr05g0217611 [Helianthus annuus]